MLNKYQIVRERVIKMEKREKISLVCYLIASICFYVGGIIGIFSKDGSNWIVNLCLGSAFLCLSTAHLNKINKNKDK